MFSMRWYPYTADNGDVYAVKRDESNTELVSSTADDKVVTAGMVPLPRGIRPRSVVVSAAITGQQKECVLLTQAEYAALSVGDTFIGTGNDGVAVATVYTLIRKNPELIRRQPVSFDTGINDGDNP